MPPRNGDATIGRRPADRGRVPNYGTGMPRYARSAGSVDRHQAAIDRHADDGIDAERMERVHFVTVANATGGHEHAAGRSVHAGD